MRISMLHLLAVGFALLSVLFFAVHRQFFECEEKRFGVLMARIFGLLSLLLFIAG